MWLLTFSSLSLILLSPSCVSSSSAWTSYAQFSSSWSTHPHPSTINKYWTSLTLPCHVWSDLSLSNWFYLHPGKSTSASWSWNPSTSSSKLVKKTDSISFSFRPDKNIIYESTGIIITFSHLLQTTPPSPVNKTLFSSCVTESPLVLEHQILG